MPIMVSTAKPDVQPETVINADIDPLMSDGMMLAEAIEAVRSPVEQRTFNGVTHEFFDMAGAILGSFVFFFALGYGSIRLRPVFERPAAWRILETLIALVIWIIAFKLLAGT
ncbi:LysE family transporter [uncultured Jannaschia sp.]|uniref:LysE family transporter n=1 Tax=uncultured Jannaschia sp. TaxID=293347 RepID=UPI00343A725C